MSDTRVIKRYANRKLYDTQHSRYVTLEQISEMIRDGDDVKIIDNKTKEDLTSVTLAQIIFEEEKKQRSFLSLQTMRQLIQNGGESFTSLITEAQRRVTSMLPRRKEDAVHESGEAASTEAGGPPNSASASASASANANANADADAAPEGSQVPQETTAMGKRGRDALAALREFREWIQQTQHTIDEWQKRVDHRIRDMVEGISPFSGIQKDVTGLAVRIAELEAKLAHLTTDVEAAAVPADPAAAQVQGQHAPTRSDAAHAGDNPGTSDA